MAGRRCSSTKSRTEAKSAAPSAPIYQLKVTLADVEPPVWRRVRVRGDLSLDRLDIVLQKAMGWHNTHLHEWTVGGRRYGVPDPDDPHYDVKKEWLLTLREAAPIESTRFEYVYDLGDGWTHEVLVERIDAPDPAFRHPQCLAGERACPPEDCGGAGGYEELLAAIRDPRHPDHEDRLAWVGSRFDPESFDVAAVNRKLRLLR